MEQNYTSIDVEKFRKGNGDRLNTFLLLIATLTALVLAILLFFLIQKKLNSTQGAMPQENLPLPTPTIKLLPTPRGASPSPKLDEAKSSTVEGQPDQKTATISPTIKTDQLTPTVIITP